MTTINRPFLTRRAKALLAVLVVISIVAIGFGPKLRRTAVGALSSKLRGAFTMRCWMSLSVAKLTRSHFFPAFGTQGMWCTGNWPWTRSNSDSRQSKLHGQKSRSVAHGRHC